MSDTTIMPLDTKRRYIGLLQKKHCGQGYFIPSLDWVVAHSKEEADDLLRDIPRVAHDRDHAVMFCKKRSLLECWFVSLINQFDKYLTSNSNNSRDLDVRERRVISPLHLATLEKRAFEDHDQTALEEYNHIKTADQYDRTQVLQRYCAPIWSKKRLIFPYIDVEKMLGEYFEIMTEQIMKQTIEMPVRENFNSEDAFSLAQQNFTTLTISRVTIMMLYYKLFGRHNPLMIRYNEAQHEMTYVKNKRKSFKIPEGIDYSQIQTFFQMAFKANNPLNMLYDFTTQNLSHDAKKLCLKFNKDIDILQLCNKLNLTQYFTTELSALNKLQAVKRIYQYLFIFVDDKGTPCDPLRANFDFETNLVIMDPRDLIHVEIPSINIPFKQNPSQEIENPASNIEEYIMNGPSRPKFAQKTQKTKFTLEEDDRSWTSQIDKFNLRVSKATTQNKGN